MREGPQDGLTSLNWAGESLGKRGLMSGREGRRRCRMRMTHQSGGGTRIQAG
jgi:hypothetical protein